MKKPVKNVGMFPALRIAGFRDNARMRLRSTGDVCVLGTCAGDSAFWVLNLTQRTKGCFTVSELAKHFDPINAEGVA